MLDEIPKIFQDVLGNRTPTRHIELIDMPTYSFVDNLHLVIYPQRYILLSIQRLEAGTPAQ